MPQFSSLIDLLTESGGKSSVSLKPSRCLRTRLKSYQCRNCEKACPHEAITLTNHPSVDPVKCSTCMLCSTVCPSDVFHHEDNSSMPLVSSDNTQEIWIYCTRQRQNQPATMVVPCLGTFSREELLFLGTRGKNKTFRFNALTCSTCMNHMAFRKFEISIQHIIEQASDFLSSTLIIDKGLADPAPDCFSSKRQFLASLKRSVVEKIIPHRQNSLNDTEDRATSRRIFQRQQWVNLALKNISPQHRDDFLQVAAHSVRILNTCEPCQRCSGICPTGALKLAREDRRKTISFNRQLCSGCGLCVLFCSNDALILDRAALLE